MKRFIQRYEDKIIGTLSGFDRLVLRGTLRGISTDRGMQEFLYQNGILFKEFSNYAQGVTNQICDLSHKIAEDQKRPFQYLDSPNTNKEQIALGYLKEHPIHQGLVCILSCVEPCNSFHVAGDRESKKLQIKSRHRMCLHVYHYSIDPVFGFMNARIQTWFPFSIQICLNGREWLARQMDQAGIDYKRMDNCFPWIKDFPKAQQLMNDQLKTNWPKTLNRIARTLNPIHDQIFKKWPINYYWSTAQTEWATDVAFKSVDDLASIYQPLIQHAMTSFSSQDVMRFLGRKLLPQFRGEVLSDYKNRLEGIRIKHRAGANSLKAYDKFLIFRVESTFNDPRDFRVLRPKETDPQKKLVWQRLRKGIADIHRRMQISQACNERYLDALAQVDTSIPLGQLMDQICQPVTYKGKSVRALRPWFPDDLALIKAVTDGRFVIQGFRNRDLQSLLFDTQPHTEKEKQQRSGRVYRLIRILRAHHLVRKVPKTHRYMMTPKGNEILTAILSLRSISLEQFKKAIA